MSGLHQQSVANERYAKRKEKQYPFQYRLHVPNRKLIIRPEEVTTLLGIEHFVYVPIPSRDEQIWMFKTQEEKDQFKVEIYHRIWEVKRKEGISK